MCIEHIFDFGFPIGWDELGVIATVLAVIVALYANRKATEQLKSALEMQEQSKNVSLLDRRVELAEAIQSGKSVSELTLQILFNGEILKHYKAWQDYRSEKVYAEYDLDRFYQEVGHLGDIVDIRYNFDQYESNMNRPDCPQEIIDEYIAYCDKYTVWLKTGENEDQMPYNHSKITERIGKATTDMKNEQILLLELIEKFIANSIKQVKAK